MIEPLRPLVDVSFKLPAEAIALGELWQAEDFTSSSSAISGSLAVYLEILGQGLREPEARQFRESLNALEFGQGVVVAGSDPYRVWEGSLTPILGLTLTRAMQRVVPASDALQAIRWVVEHADVRRSGEAWVAVAYGLDDDAEGSSVGKVSSTPDDAVLEYLQRIADVMDL